MICGKDSNFKYTKSILLYLFLGNGQLGRSKQLEVEASSGPRVLCCCLKPILLTNAPPRGKMRKASQGKDFLNSGVGLATGRGEPLSAPSGSGGIFDYRHCLELLVPGDKKKKPNRF